MLNDLMLLSGIDIPFVTAQLNIHQPTIKEIAYIGEEKFFIGCEVFRFTKDSLTSEDKTRLQTQSNFDIIMSILKERKNPSLLDSAIAANMVLMLLFPEYSIQLKTNYIELSKIVNTVEVKDGVPKEVQEKRIYKIDESNFDEFKNILNKMFVLKEQNKVTYNPQGDMAQKIADKLKKGAQKRAQLKGQTGPAKISIFSRYASILAVGTNKNLNDLMQYTVYQLLDEFQRFQLKISYDVYVQAKMAGAKDLQEVDSWLKDIHEENNNK